MSDEEKISFGEYLLLQAMDEKGAKDAPMPFVGDYLFDFNGDLVGILVEQVENSGDYARCQFFFDKTKQRIVKASFRNKKEELCPTLDK